MSLIPDKIVHLAYKKLKQMTYYEKSHLFLRKRLAEFESGDDFMARMQTVEDVIMADAPADSEQFQSWIKDIEFEILPKGLKQAEPPCKDQGTFVTNVTSHPKYRVEKVNYLFVGPVELHLIAVLWLMTEGYKLDHGLPQNCMGSRLHSLVGQSDDHSGHLFKKYHELYAKWRDDGINKARSLLTEESRGVCIIALDLQEYFYRVQIDWKKLRDEIPHPKQNGHIKDRLNKAGLLGGRLFSCIEVIFKGYRQQISSSLSITHPDLPDSATCLPIGLCASPVIANWYLREFDTAVLSKVRPAYYGRYVDDILLVVACESVASKDPIKEFMDEVLVSTGILKWLENQNRYELVSRPSLCLQKSKCILQFFDAKHSIAGLEKFQKEIEENASDFALLPVEGDDSPVEQVAYDLLYDGSVNKLRSVKEIAENRWELAKHLAKQTQLYLVASGAKNRHMTTELFRFFKGRNALDYWDMWERVIAFLVITGGNKELEEFCAAVKGEIRKISNPDAPEISRRLRKTLTEHLNIALKLTKAVRDSNFESKNSESGIWRYTNLIRHHLVAVPLLNYSNFDGDLSIPPKTGEFSPGAFKIEWSPRFVHFDECMGFVDSGFAEFTDDESLTIANELYYQFHGNRLEDVKSQVVNAKPRVKK